MPPPPARRRGSRRPSKTFSEADFSSGDGFVTRIWGPMMWFILHTMSFNYPVHPTAKQKRGYRRFLLSLRDVLPCGKCRTNLAENFRKLPPTDAVMQNRATFSRYIYDLHELVNDMLEKPRSGRPSYEEVRELYENFRARCTTPSPSDTPSITGNQSHKGCVEPLYGKKSRCVIRVVPQASREATLQVNRRCMKTRRKPTSN
jgi:hypothetical protein